MSNEEVRRRVVRLCCSRCRQNLHRMFICRRKIEKLEGPQILGSRGAPTPKIFFAKMCFFECPFEITHFHNFFIFLFFGGHPTPKFLTIFVFVPIFVIASVFVLVLVPALIFIQIFVFVATPITPSVEEFRSRLHRQWITASTIYLSLIHI